MIQNFIQKMREKKGLSQEYFAKKLDMSRPTYIALEKGERDMTLHEVKVIAKLLDLTFNQLINEEESSINVDIKESTEDQNKSQELRISIYKELQ